MQLDLSVEPILWILVIMISVCFGWFGSSLWYGRRLRRVHKQTWAAAERFYKDREADIASSKARAFLN